MSLRVAYATAPPAYLGFDDTDRPLHDAAAAAAGFRLDHVVWSDPGADWDRYDLVVVRSTWDYLDHLEAYLAWLTRVDATGRLHNPGPVVAWNLDKCYLLDLAEAGVPVIPTRRCRDADDVAGALDGHPGEVVVKPTVSAGSRNTGLFAPGDPAAGVLAARILADGSDVLVQPAVPSVADAGEVSALVFGGTVSHAVRKGPLLALGGGLVGGTYTEQLAPEVLTADQRAVVEVALDAVARLVADRFGIAEPLLYARIDLVDREDGRVEVLEVELAEPAFFLDTAPGSADRFAAEVARRARAAGPAGG